MIFSCGIPRRHQQTLVLFVKIKKITLFAVLIMAALFPAAAQNFEKDALYEIRPVTGISLSPSELNL